mgnify:CR=1 FL=1
MLVAATHIRPIIRTVTSIRIDTPKPQVIMKNRIFNTGLSNSISTAERAIKHNEKAIITFVNSGLPTSLRVGAK